MFYLVKDLNSKFIAIQAKDRSGRIVVYGEIIEDDFFLNNEQEMVLVSPSLFKKWMTKLGVIHKVNEALKEMVLKEL